MSGIHRCSDQVIKERDQGVGFVEIRANGIGYV